MQQFWLNSKDLKKQSNQPWPSFVTKKEKRIEKKKKSSWGERFFNEGNFQLPIANFDINK